MSLDCDYPAPCSCGCHYVGPRDRAAEEGSWRAEAQRLRAEKAILRAALVGMVDEDDPETLRQMLGAVKTMAALGVGAKDAKASIAAIEALIEVRP